ncbi:phage tail length tape measure family protein [Pleomorphomonas koreensis]|uniref:phage tail length tape measure family protein n=1 Tax=Pleomorphomonas koreensis TaxID=257440 RepID=UPI00042320BC|nr:phage tail length tape measure family protein [Pleomorphomonas koreensis]
MANQFRVSIGVDLDAARAKAGAGETRQAIQSIGESATQATPKVQSLDAALGGLHDGAAQAKTWQGILASEGMALDNLRAKYNPLFATIQQYKAAQTEIRTAHAMGALSADEMTAALARQRQQALSTIAAIKGLGTAQAQNGAASATRRNYGWQQLGLQGNDVLTMAMLGAPAGQIAASQGPQIFQTMQMWDGGVSGAMSDISSTVTGLITRFPLLTAAAAAAGLAMTGIYVITRREGPSTEEALARHEELVKRIKDAYGDAAASVGKLRTEEKSILAFQAGQNATDLKTNLSAELERERNALRARFIDQSGMTFGAALPIEAPLRSFIESSDESGKSLEELRKKLTDIGANTADNDLKKLIDSIIETTAETDTLRATVETALRDLPKLSAEYQKFVRNQALASNGFRQLGDFIPDQRTNAQKIEDIYGSSIGSAQTLGEVETLNRRRAEALAEVQRQLDLTRQSDDLGTQAILARTAAERASIAAAQARVEALRQGGRSEAEIAEAERAARANVFAQESASSRSTLEQAQRSAAGVGLTGLPATIAQINARYDLEIQKAEGAKEAIDNLRKARELEIQTATRSAAIQPLQDTAQSASELERAVALQRATFGKSAGDAANLTEQMRLYNEYARAGIQITPELSRAIAEAGARYGAAAGEMDKVTKAQQDAIGRIDGLRSATNSMLGSLLEGDWDSIGKTATNWASGIITDQLTQGLLGRQGEAGGGLFGDLASSLLGGTARGASAANPVFVTFGGAGAGGLFGNLTAANSNGLGVVGGTSMLSRYREAIASIESSGRYGALGPVTASGDRAYGRYGVMGSNVGPWTQQALGYSMTPNQFLGSSTAQDAVFNKIFGGLLSKFGNADDAASAWFTGRPLAQGANATDILGTTGSAYVDKFNAALGTATTGLESFASTTRGASTGSIGAASGYPASLTATPAQAAMMPAGVSPYGTGWAEQQVSGLSASFSVLNQGVSSIVDQFVPGLGSVLGQLLNGIASAGGSSGGGGGFFSWIGSLFTGGSGWGADNSAAFMPYAYGGIPPGRGLHSYANQVVSTPTVFAFAKGAGVMGEAGEKEGIFPLTRDAAGRLGVRASWAGQGGQDSGTSVQINNYSGARVEHETTRDSRGRRQEKFVISDAVGDAVATPGGGADRAMRQKYGVRSRGIPR